VIFNGKPSVVGHRGFGAHQPGGYQENTIASYQAAVASGLDWIELDVQRSSDDELVVRHDPVTPAGDPVVGRSAAELAAFGILRLEEALAAIPPDVSVNVDVKSIIEDGLDPTPRRTANLVADALRRHAGRRKFYVSSFDPSVLLFLKESRTGLGDVSLGLITWLNFPVHHAIPAAANLGLDAVCLHTGTLSMQREMLRPVDYSIEDAVSLAHLAGLEVLVWVPGPADAVRAARAGADAVCVNDVPGVLAALAQERSASASEPGPAGTG
jgi:glycerophosphoryl diester phosphodiesterase